MSEPPSHAEPTTIQIEIYSGINTLEFLTQTNVCEYAVVRSTDDIMRIQLCNIPRANDHWSHFIQRDNVLSSAAYELFGGKEKINRQTITMVFWEWGWYM